jgi:hypothetical protein
MTTTDDLIHSLARGAGARRSVSLQTALAVAAAASLACAVLLIVSVIGIRQDFADMAVRLPFAFKLVYTVSLVAGAFVAALYVVLLALGVAFDPTAFPIMGRTDTAVAFCVSYILFLSLPAMVLTFVVMQKGAPTQPLFAGAVIGLLSASVGAMAYTLACKNDGTAFVAIWYTVACIIMTAIGAVVGYRVLRW